MNFNHLKEVDETYTEHFRFSFSMACRMLWGGICILTHSIFPFACVTNGGDAIRKCYTVMNTKFPDKTQ
jgi:hypothetical protein